VGDTYMSSESARGGWENFRFYERVGSRQKVKRVIEEGERNTYIYTSQGCAKQIEWPSKRHASVKSDQNTKK